MPTNPPSSPEHATVTIGTVAFGGGAVGWILGPCSLEDERVALGTAERLAELATTLGIGVVFKGSFDKANRTSGTSPRGPGLHGGLRLLERVRRETGLPVLTDVHEAWQAEPAAAVVDALQIPAFLCRQTNLIVAAAATGKPLLIKKGQFMAPEDMGHAVAKAGPGARVLLGERGTSFGYRDLVVDFRGIPVMRRFAPVVFDGTHAAQRPGAAGGASGGDRGLVPHLCRAAAAVGVDGFFLETHPDPEHALSDRATQIPLAELSELLRMLRDLVERCAPA